MILFLVLLQSFLVGELQGVTMMKSKKLMMGFMMVVLLLLGYFILVETNQQTKTENDHEQHMTVAKVQTVGFDMKQGYSVSEDFDTELDQSVSGAIVYESSLSQKISNKNVVPTLDLLHPIVTMTENSGEGFNVTWSLENIHEPVGLVVIDDKDRVIKRQVVETIGESKNFQGHFIYKAVVSGLGAGETYYYRAETKTEYGQFYSVTIPKEQTMSLYVFGDIQGYKQSQYDAFADVYEMAVNTLGSSDGYVLAGDIVDVGDNMDEWQYFYNAGAPFLPSKPLLTTIGNHDVKGSALQYLDSFHYPENGVSGLDERNFFINIPNGRIAVIDTESVDRFEEQQIWLTEMMSDEALEHKIVVMHRSIYPISYNEAHVRIFAETFEALDIDLVFSGHDHIYSRTTVSDGALVDLSDGVTYVVCGSGSGSKFYSDKEDERFWKQVIYDEDNPVVVRLELGENIRVHSYGLVEEAFVLVDSFQLDK